MFKKFFMKDEEEEEVYETVDPVLEQRRKEKFSTPLIYNEEEEEKKQEEKKEVKKTEPKKFIPPVSESTYHMSEIISPISGIKESRKPEVHVSKPKPKKIKKDIEVKAKMVKEEPSVEQNLRNIAKIVEEEQDQLKIIEERTGEFKLDLNKEDEDSFIDEIEDSMSLDELMSLYEKKFKD